MSVRMHYTNKCIIFYTLDRAGILYFVATILKIYLWLKNAIYIKCSIYFCKKRNRICGLYPHGIEIYSYVLPVYIAELDIPQIKLS